MNTTISLPLHTAAIPGHAPTLKVLLAAGVEQAEAQAALGFSLLAEQQAAQVLDAARLAAELAAIASAGGEKGLGSNEAAQRRALNAAVEASPAVAQARTALQTAQLDRRIAESDVTLATAQCQALLVALQADIYYIPADWIADPADERAGCPVALSAA